jgi:hypothetical protein
LAIQPFDYRGAALGDDLDRVVDHMLAAQALLFATPVYWYAMSGRLKTLFDRFTDLLSDRDSARRGRRLSGRRMWALAVGTDPELPAGFYEPFRLTAAYLDLVWGGGLYVSTALPEPLRTAQIRDFASNVAATLPRER